MAIHFPESLGYSSGNRPSLEYRATASIEPSPLTLAKMFLTVLIWCFFFHFLNGIRHLIWDTGHGFDPKVVRISGWAILLGATVLAGAYSLLMVF